LGDQPILTERMDIETSVKRHAPDRTARSREAAMAHSEITRHASVRAEPFQRLIWGGFA